MIVVDTNILAYRFIDDPHSSNQALAQKVLTNDRVVLPTLWRHEFLNVLTNNARAGRLDLSEATRCWYQALATAQEAETEVDMVRALELSQELNISAYDAQFVALAEGANAILVTQDKRLRTAVGGRAMSMEDYLAA